LDVISGGREAVRSSRLARLAEATGGAIVIEDDFGASFAANLAAAARRPTRRDAVLSVRASSGVGCARVIGAAEAMRPEEAAAATATGAGGGDGAANKAEDSADAFRLKTADASQVSVSPRSFSPRWRRASLARGITSLPPHFSLESAGQIASPDFTSEPLAKSSACSCAGMGFVWVAHSRSSTRFRKSRSGAAYQLVAPEHNGRPS
jgi:hypothetical protein